MKSTPDTRSLLAGALLAAVTTAASAGSVLDRIRATGTLTIAHREASLPFSYLDADKRPIGYAVELCQRLAAHVRDQLAMKSLVVNYVMVTPATRIQTVASGAAELECGSTANNAERRKTVAFTIPHYITGARYLVRSDSPIGELAHFERKKLVSTKGTTVLKAIDQANRERMLQIGIMEAPDHGQAVEMVERGEADGFAMDDVLLYGLISTRTDPSKLKVVGKFLTIEPLAIMMSKDDPEFKKMIDGEMKRMILTREAYAIYERWFQRPIAPRNTALGLPMNYLLKDFWKYPTDLVPF